MRDIAGIIFAVLLIALLLRLALIGVKRRRQKSAEAQPTKAPVKTNWRGDFEGISPKPANAPAVSASQARQVYQELQQEEQLSPKLVEEAKHQVLQELQQIVDDHSKKSKPN